MPDLSTIDVAGKRVFLRCDLNVPLKEGVIKDDGRIKASLPTIQALLEKGASLVIAAHLGRPKGCLLYTSPSPRDRQKSRMPSSA